MTKSQAGERILKIGQHLAKLEAKMYGTCFPEALIMTYNVLVSINISRGLDGQAP